MAVKPRHLLALAPALIALWAAPSASAFAVSGTVTPANLQAGAHSNIAVHVDFTAGQVKDLRIGLPPGVIGDPTATPLCTVAQLNANSCPANTQVGEVAAVANILTIVGPLNIPGKLFNLEPQPGEPARFGIVLTPPLLQPIILQSAVELRKTDFGLDTVINNIPNTTLLAGDTTIVSQDITLYGVAPGTGKTFMRNPTYCTPATTNFAADSYAAPGTTVTDQDSFTATGCGALPFAPRFSAQIGPMQPGANTTKAPVTTSIDQDVGEAGLKKAQVFLPPGLGPDLPILDHTCPPASFTAGSCPASSVVGQATATSSILAQPLTGPLVLIANYGLPKLGLDLHGPLAIQLQGTFLTTGGTGVQFDGLPDIPISHFELRFTGGPSGLLIANSDLCKPPGPVFRTIFDSYTGITRTGSPVGKITGCGQGTYQIKGSLRKAHSSEPRLKLSVASSLSKLGKVTVKLPKKLRLGPGKRGISARGDSRLAKSAIKHGKRSLTLEPGASSLKLRIGGGELERTGPLGKRVRVKVKIADASGNTSTQTVKLKARG
jgi:hypothetical protein